MARTTDIRNAIKAALADLPGEADVALGPSEYAEGNGFATFNFYVRVALGEQSEETDDLMDSLLEAEGERSVKRLIEECELLKELVSDVTVTKVSGQQLFPPTTPGGIPSLGATWTARTFL